MAEKYRFYEIDLFRFLAAMSVVMYHYTYRGFAAGDYSPIEFPVMGLIFKYGYLGIDLFFIISGFVILMTALNRDSSHFVISRVIRLYPAYWFSVTLTFICILIYQGPQYSATFQQYLVNLTMIHSFVGVKHIDAVYWTLLVELRFYLLIFLLLMIKQIHRIQLFLFVWTMASVVLNNFGGPGFLNFFLIPAQSGYFIAGAVFFLIRHEGMDLKKLFLVLTGFLLVLQHAYVDLPNMNAKFNTEFSFEIIATVLFSFFVLFFLVSLKKTYLLARPSFYYVGILTYPLYLIHQNIGFMLLTTFSEAVNKYILLMLVVLLMVLLSYFIHFFIERKYAPVLKSAMTRAFNHFSGSSRVVWLRLAQARRGGR